MPAGGIKNSYEMRTHWAEDAVQSSPSPEAADAVAAAGQEVWSDLQHLTQAALLGERQQVEPNVPSTLEHGAQQHSNRQVGYVWVQPLQVNSLQPPQHVEFARTSWC
jgi:hypothetical protein